jgi:hypothetical protein
VGDAINFDDEFFGAAHEVYDVGVDGFLSGEFYVVQLAVSQGLPEFGFGCGGFAAQGSGVGQSGGVFSHVLKLRPLTLPLQEQWAPTLSPIGRGKVNPSSILHNP